MAGDAFRRQTLELACGGVFVAVITGQSGVRPDQRKSVLVRPQLAKTLLPASHGMATLAIGSELSAVDISVAVCATGSRLCENQTDVALRARDPFVQAPQRIARLVVVKLNDVAERLP